MNSLSSMDLFIIIIALVCLVLAAIFIPRYMVLNAMKKIIRSLIKKNALDLKSAVTADEIGIRYGAMWDNMFRMRDYRPQALQMLLESEIIVNTMDGRYYISTDKLRISRFGDLYNEAD